MEKKTVFENGVRVVSERLPDFYSVSLGIWVKVGCRHESREENGVSHFIEHMLFKGTEKRTSRDIALQIDSVGGMINAFTSKEYTCFFVKVLKDDLPLAFDILADIFFNSRFPTEELERERKVILQEISMVLDNPEDYVHDLFSFHFWGDHPLGRPIQGTKESVSSLHREALLNFMEQKYQPEDTIICAAGDIKHEDLVKLARDSFSSWKQAEAGQSIPPSKPAPHIYVESRALEQAHIYTGFRGPSQVDDRRWPAFIMNTILGRGMSSRLFQEIREKRGLVYAVYSTMEMHKDCGGISIYAGTSPTLVNEIIELIFKELNDLKQKPLSPEELSKAKGQIKGNMLLGMEATESRMGRLARNEIYYDRFVPVEEVISQIEAVTPEDVQEIAGQIFTPKNMSLVALGELSKSDIKKVSL